MQVQVLPFATRHANLDRRSLGRGGSFPIRDLPGSNPQCGLDIKAGAAKLKADRAARAEAELVVDRWNRRLARGRDMPWSPTSGLRCSQERHGLMVSVRAAARAEPLICGHSIVTRWLRSAFRRRFDPPKRRRSRNDRASSSFGYAGKKESSTEGQAGATGRRRRWKPAIAFSTSISSTVSRPAKTFQSSRNRITRQPVPSARRPAGRGRTFTERHCWRTWTTRDLKNTSTSSSGFARTVAGIREF
jgi:hypothetical protein